MIKISIKIKYIIPFLLLFIFIPIKVNAASYQYVNRETFGYDINNYYIDNGYIIINGWGVTATDQQLTGNDTHEFSMILTNVKNGQVKTYIAQLKSANKTELMRMKTTHRVCGYYEVDAPSTTCYYNYAMAGFEFRIPLSDLEADTEYEILLRIWAKIVNRRYQIQIYTPSINRYYEVNGIRYLLNSDMSRTYATIVGEPVFVRSGPAVGYAKQSGWQWCSSSYTYTLYWWLYHTYYNIQQVVQTNPGAIDSETWLNIGFNQGICVGGRSRASNGNSYNGWIAAIYADYSGIPATIKTYKVKNTSIDKIKAYTVVKNTTTKIVTTLYNNYNQTNNVKAYHNGVLVYNQNIAYTGSKDLTINYNIPNEGNARIVITEPNGLTTELTTQIYVSSQKVYTVDKQTLSIVDSTPTLVTTSKDGNISKYYEKISYTIPSIYNKVTAGKGFEIWVNMNYYNDSTEFSINNNISAFSYFDSQDENLTFPIIQNKVKVNLEKVTQGINNNMFSIQEFVFNKLTGKIYSSNVPENINITNGGRKWYTSVNEKIDVYNYKYEIENIGINKIKIIIPCKYEIDKTLFGYNDSEYFIKRIKIPENLNLIFKKSYTAFELYGGN